MKIRVLGAHNMETANARHTCFLVNDKVAIDAGSLMTSLTPEEKDGLQVVLLTHRHYDHLRDLPSLGLATMDNGATVALYGLAETFEALASHLMDGLLYPNFTERPTKSCPKYRLNNVTPGDLFRVFDMEARAVSVPHGAPAIGFVLRSGRGVAAFTGDTGGGLDAFLSDQFKPQLLFVDVTFSNAGESKAQKSGHLTPAILHGELEAALRRGLPVPRIVAVHMDQRHEDAVRRELAEVSVSLGVEIVPGTEDAEFTL